MNQENNNKLYDVLIVGAGMSGLFAAWRLLHHDNSLSIKIIDKLNRTGGRLQTTTVNIKGKDGLTYTVRDEEGGMRFVPKGKGMENLWKLIDTFTSRPNPPFATSAFPMGDDNNRYYMRSTSFTRSELKSTNNAIWSDLYHLKPNERGKAPTDLLNEVISDILVQNGAAPTAIPSSPAEWINFRNKYTYKDSQGTPIIINKWGFWPLIRQYGFSEECIEMLNHAIGFMGPFEQLINAGEGLQIIFDFPASANFFTLNNGFESLPTALENDIRSIGGTDTIQLNETVLSVEPIGDIIYTYSNKMIYQSKKLILAAPKKAMEKIMEKSPILNENEIFTESVSSVHNMELTKVGLYFNERWWHKNENINLSNGPNFTDLPAGSIYTFSQFPDDPVADANYNGPAALTLYTEFTRGNFWKEIQNIGQPYQTTEFPSNPIGTYPATTNLVNEMMRQIKLIFGLAEDDNTVPMPVLSAYRQWGQGEFGYGYHQYKLNVDDRAVYFGIINPAKNIYVCNESWSPEQGWVEGSLIMSDFVMQWGFGLTAFTDITANFFNEIKNKK